MDPDFNEKQCHGVFIRAPAVMSVDSDETKVVGTIEDPKASNQEVVVAVRKENLIGTSFHPELTENLDWQKYFIDLILKNKNEK